MTWQKIEPILARLSVLFILLFLGAMWLLDRNFDTWFHSFNYKPQMTVIGSREAQATQNNLQASLKTRSAGITDIQTDSAAAEGKESVLQSVEKWRSAWQAQNIAAYIAQYIDDYRPASAQSHEAWVNDRKLKLTRPKTISVRLDQLQVQPQDNQRWKATFLQHYQSDIYQDIVTKELLLIKVGDHYLIEKERVL